MLSAQYRSPINYSYDLIQQAKTGLDRIYNCMENLKEAAAKDTTDADFFAEHKQKFIDAMDDDLNSADAVGAVFELVKDLNTRYVGGESTEGAKAGLNLLTELLDVLGLLREASNEIPEEIVKMAEERAQARKDKNWALADSLRDKIKELGYELKDSADGVKITKI